MRRQHLPMRQSEPKIEVVLAFLFAAFGFLTLIAFATTIGVALWNLLK